MLYPVPKPTPRAKKSQRPVRKMKAGHKASLEREAVRLWGRAVLMRDGYRCRIILQDGTRCPRVATDPHHIISRRYKAVKLDPRNGLAVCCHHHREDLNCLRDNVLRTIGQEEFDSLRDMAYRGCKNTDDDLDGHIQTLRGLIDEYENSREENATVHTADTQAEKAKSG